MKKILLKMINFYQSLPITSHRNCKFVPTCSEYTKQSIETHGSFLGLIYGLIRVLRCNPFSKGGLDPVKGVKNNEKN